MATGEKSISQVVADAITTHHVNLLRVAADLRGPVFNQLLALEKSIVGEIATLPEDAGVVKVARLHALLAQTKGIVDEAYTTIAANQGKQLKDIAGLEADKTGKTYNSAIGVNLLTVGMTKEEMQRLADHTLINGAFQRQWWGQQSEDLKRRFEAQMRDGMYRGEGIGALVSRTRELMNVKRYQAEAIVRTSVLSVANQSKLDSFEKNLDVIKGVQWLATLDSRTTPVCIALDGKQWTLPEYEPIGHKIPFPGPIAHWNCRSTQIAVVKSWEELGGQPAITTENIQDYAGDVDVDALKKYAGNELGAFEMTAGAKVVPLSKLVSTKNELLDPKFLAGQKADPRSNAIKGMLGALERGAKPRTPLEVYRNANGTYTIVDGNATAQAAMLAGWEKVPVKIVPKPGTLPVNEIEEIFRTKLAAKGFTKKEIDEIVAEKRFTIDGEPAPRQTFDEFLTKQTKEFQDKLLGVQKAQLWREGKITLNELIDQTGRPLSVDELRSLVAKNKALAAPKYREWQDGLGLMERKLLEESLVHGAQNHTALGHFVDMATGQRVTVKSLSPTAEEMGFINKMQNVMYLRNGTGIGEIFTPQEVGLFGQIKGFGGARIVTPDGRVVSITLRASRESFTLADAKELNIAITDAMASKSNLAALKAAVEKNGALKYEQTATKAVVPTSKQYAARPDDIVAKPEQVAAMAARELYQRAQIKESAVTQLLTSIAKEQRAEMAGLDFRLKTEESLARKIALDSRDKGIPVGDAMAQVSDALRYTMVLPDDRYARGVKATLAALERDGLMKVERVKNFWDGVSYEGINVKLRTADGFPVELQFHTPLTLLTKEERSHPIYELMRATTDPTALKAYKQQLEDLWKDVQTPKGAKLIGDDWREVWAKDLAVMRKAIEKRTAELATESKTIRESMLPAIEKVTQIKAEHDALDAEAAKMWKEFQRMRSVTAALPPSGEREAELAALRKTVWDLQKKRDQLWKDYTFENANGIGKVRSKLELPEAERMTLDVARDKSVAAIAEEGAQILASLVPDGRLLPNTAEFDGLASATRGFFNPKDGRIYLSPTESTARTALHELGHWIEANNPAIRQTVHDFLNERTAGETAEKLSKLIQNHGYEDYEFAKPDKFMSPYMGKIYKDDKGQTYATEILSMGLEYLWFNPVEFARDDPKYFDFIFKLIKLVDPMT